MFIMKLRKRKQISYYEPEELPFDEYIYCEKCGDVVFEYCSVHGPLLVIPDDKVPEDTGMPEWVPRAALTTPRVFLHIAPSIIPGAGLGVFSTLTLPRGVRFGPYRGKRTKEISSVYCWQLRDRFGKYSTTVVDAEDGNTSNWMRYVNCARHKCEQNLIAYQYQGEIYYRTIKVIPKFTELMVFYGSEFANLLDIDLRKYNSTQQYYNVIGKVLIIDERVDNNHITMKQEDNIVIDENMTNWNDEINDDISDNHQTVLEYVEEIITEESNDIKMDISETDNDFEDSTLNYDFLDNNDMKFHENLIANQLHTNDISDNALTGYNSIDSIDNRNECVQAVILKSEPQNLNFSNNSHSYNTEKQNVCHICNKTFTLSKYLRRHRRRHIEPARFHCVHCNYKTNVYTEYKRHVNRHNKLITEHLNTKDDITDINKCNTKENTKEHPATVTCNAENQYLNALVSDNIANESKYTCLVCNKTYNNLDSFRRHKISHIDPMRFSCVKCSYKTNYPYRYKSHIKTHENVATENFETEKSITTDINKNSNENGENRNATVTCRAEKQDLNTISNQVNDNKYSCYVCNKTYNNLDSFRRHKISHIDPMRFSCVKCSYKTNYPYRYKSHVKTHETLATENNIITDINNLNEIEQNKNVADICTAENQCLNTLFSDNNETDNKFTCHECNKTYNNLRAFRRHKISHIDPMRFSCVKCSYKTNYSDKYKRHLKQHS